MIDKWGQMRYCFLTLTLSLQIARLPQLTVPGDRLEQEQLQGAFV